MAESIFMSELVLAVTLPRIFTACILTTTSADEIPIIFAIAYSATAETVELC